MSENNNSNNNIVNNETTIKEDSNSKSNYMAKITSVLISIKKMIPSNIKFTTRKGLATEPF